MVFCEGIASEPDYINGLKRLPGVRRNTAVTIEIDPNPGTPLPLVQRAIAHSKDEEVDECWCVFDVEAPKKHPHLAEAIRLAEQHGIGVAISNPCFELWLILHHEARRAYLTTAEAEKLSRSHDGRAGKRIDARTYVDARHVAVERAIELATLHERNQTPFPENNPSSTMPDLLAAIERPPTRG